MVWPPRVHTSRVIPRRAAELAQLESAMWEAATRLDRSWMDRHLAWDFIEFGGSGRTYDRAAILDAIRNGEAELPSVRLNGLVVR